MVKCSGYTFQRIDTNDELSIAVGFTMRFHECTFDSECNFVVRKDKGSELEKKCKIDDVSKYFNVWEKQKIKQGR